jgi:hypothetical protein
MAHIATFKSPHEPTSPHKPKEKAEEIPLIYKWQSHSMAHTATFKSPHEPASPHEPKEKVEGKLSNWSENQPPWLTQPPSTIS